MNTWPIFTCCFHNFFFEKKKPSIFVGLLLSIELVRIEYESIIFSSHWQTKNPCFLHIGGKISTFCKFTLPSSSCIRFNILAKSNKHVIKHFYQRLLYHMAIFNWFIDCDSIRRQLL